MNLSRYYQVSILATMLAVVAGASNFAIAATPKTASNSSTTPAHATTAPANAKTTPKTAAATTKPATANSSELAKLHLTNDQKQKIQQLLVERRQAIAKILDNTQKTKLNEGLKAHQKISAILPTLNLTATQKQKIAAVIKNTNQKIEGILTAQQLKQIKQMQQQKTTAAIE